MVNNALIDAAEAGNLELVRCLVEQHGADVNDKGFFGNTALMCSARSGHLDIVEYLAGVCGVDVNGKRDDGDTALMCAARWGHLSIVQYLAGECGAEVNAIDNEGRTALWWAASAGHLSIVQYLAGERDADVNVKDDYGYSALMASVVLGLNIEIAQLLAAKYDADVSIPDNAPGVGAVLPTGHDGHTLLMWAAQCGYINMVRWLSDSDANECEIELFQSAHEIHDANVNAKNEDGYSALMLAIMNGRVEVAQYLVDECGANVSAPDSESRFSMEVDSRDNDGYTMLMWTVKRGYVDVVQWLADQIEANYNTQLLAGLRDAYVNATNNDGYSALMLAAVNGYVEIAQCLAEKCGAGVNIQDKDGNNAVCLAMNYGYYDIVQILTPHLQPADQVDASDLIEITSGRPPSFLIPPFEIELTVSKNYHFGGDFQAKWLDADVIVKLFHSNVSYSLFEDEAYLWQRLRHPRCTACLNQPTICNSSYRMWKYLHEAGLGLEYLHERSIVHGGLCCRNILIGSDGMARISNFGFSGALTKSSFVVGHMRWQAPEVLRGEPPSYASDVYSLGMCILEATTGEVPWSYESEESTRNCKAKWTPETGSTYFSPYAPPGDARELIWRMCSHDPSERANLSRVVHELEYLELKSCSSYDPHFDNNVGSCFHEYKGGKLEEMWLKIQSCMEGCDNSQYCKVFDELKSLRRCLCNDAHHTKVLERYESLQTQFYLALTMAPQQVKMMRLSSTRVTTTSVYAFQWRIESLKESLGLKDPVDTSTQWRKRSSQQTELFVLGVSDTFLLLQDIQSPEERSAFLRTLKDEIEDALGKYTNNQLEGMKRTYKEITSKLEADSIPELTPEWFIPWYELIIDEWNCLGEGGFGSVHQAKWLDSDVVVKRVTLDITHDSNRHSSLSTSPDPSATQAEAIATKRAQAISIFRREVDIWFRFGHPHVVRLFGACHVGRPFFVCEYATNGTLVSYLRKHPDELWSKLHEAALGVQYLHARDVIHGDLKGNNIVIGSDLKAKVTDFGLSSVSSSESDMLMSGAWNWVAPELLDTNKRPTFASDVYSLGMCIVEALRVVEAVKSGKKSDHCLPWCVADRSAMKYHATRGKLPKRPPLCADSQWELVTRMCALDPGKRIKISTVVDELKRLVELKNAGGVTELTGISVSDIVSWKAIPKVIVAAQHLLDSLKDGSGKHNDVFLQYHSLWERIEQVHSLIDDGQSDKCRSQFASLVAASNAATTKLQANGASLGLLAVKIMGCYALHRKLEKLCEAYFLDENQGDS